MTKKDYELIANELKSQHEMLGYNGGNIQGNGQGATPTVYEMSCKLWSQTLKKENERFDEKRFLEACGVK